MNDDYVAKYKHRLVRIDKDKEASLVETTQDVSHLKYLSLAGPPLVITLIAGIGLALFLSPFLELSPLRKAATVSLFASTAVIFAAWSWYPRRNLEILEYWFPKRLRSPVRFQLEFWSVILIIVSLVGLFVTVLWPLYYALVFIAYSSAYYLGVYLLTETVRTTSNRLIRDVESVQGTEDKAEGLHNAMLDGYVVVLYYHTSHNKHYWQVAALGAVGVVGLTLAVLDETDILAHGAEASAFLMGTALLVAEGVKYWWRVWYYNTEEKCRTERKAQQQGQTTGTS